MAELDADRPPASAGRLVQNFEVLTRHGAFGRVLIATTGARPVTLRGTGPDVWDFFETPHTEPELVEWLAQRYQVAPAIITRDVAPALMELRDEGLLGDAP